MSRRRKKSSQGKQGLSGILIGLLVLLPILIIAAVFYIFILKSAPSAPLIDVHTYTRNSKSLYGNVVKVVGVIKSNVSLESGEALLEVNPDEVVHSINAKNVKPLPMFVSQDVRAAHKGLNLDISYSYEFIVNVDSNGYLVVESIATK